MEGDGERAVRLLIADVDQRRAAAADALAVASERRTDTDRDLIRRLAVGLTNLGRAQNEQRDPAAAVAITEAVALAREHSATGVSRRKIASTSACTG